MQQSGRGSKGQKEDGGAGGAKKDAFGGGIILVTTRSRSGTVHNYARHDVRPSYFVVDFHSLFTGKRGDHDLMNIMRAMVNDNWIWYESVSGKGAGKTESGGQIRCKVRRGRRWRNLIRSC